MKNIDNETKQFAVDLLRVAVTGLRWQILGRDGSKIVLGTKRGAGNIFDIIDLEKDSAKNVNMMIIDLKDDLCCDVFMNRTVATLLSPLDNVITSKKSNPYRMLFEEACAEFENGRWEEAVDIFKESAKRLPGCAELDEVNEQRFAKLCNTLVPKSVPMTF